MMEPLFMPRVTKREVGDAFAGAMGTVLQQEYRGHDDGTWWLYAIGRPMRELRPDEVAWHVARNHAPFVEGGVEKDDPRWFDDPEESKGAES